jgi:aryl-alcohol dehydrogenase-like predicted oxidoreductase
MIGWAAAHRRGDFSLFTKCGHPAGPGAEDWRPESLLQSIQLSLRRLKTDQEPISVGHSNALFSRVRPAY